MHFPKDPFCFVFLKQWFDYPLHIFGHGPMKSRNDDQNHSGILRSWKTAILSGSPHELTSKDDVYKFSLTCKGLITLRIGCREMSTLWFSRFTLYPNDEQMSYWMLITADSVQKCNERGTSYWVTAGEQIEWSIQHLGHDSHQSSLAKVVPGPVWSYSAQLGAKTQFISFSWFD